eukprot:scaffold34999_cov18-Tisochrysis_lutea.AAC.3
MCFSTCDLSALTVQLKHGKYGGAGSASTTSVYLLYLSAQNGDTHLKQGLVTPNHALGFQGSHAKHIDYKEQLERALNADFRLCMHHEGFALNQRSKAVPYGKLLKAQGCVDCCKPSVKTLSTNLPSLKRLEGIYLRSSCAPPLTLGGMTFIRLHRPRRCEPQAPAQT